LRKINRFCPAKYACIQGNKATSYKSPSLDRRKSLAGIDMLLDVSQVQGFIIIPTDKR